MDRFPKFTFNNYDSYDDLGIIVNEISPITLPQRDIESIQVEGSNRILHIDKGAFLPIPAKIKCTLYDVSKLDTLKQLFKASGEIEFSDNPGRVYKCTNTNQVDWTRFKGLTEIRDFNLNFELEPVAFGDEIEVTKTESDTFIADGTENSNPVITVTGTGILSLNGISVNFLESGITLDCENMEAYTGLISKNDKIKLDDFPYVKPGANDLVLPATITSVTITYRERWL